MGASQEEYNFHKDLLIDRCPYFAAALKEDWNNGKDTCTLQDAIPADFDVVAYWVYTGTLPEGILDDDDDDSDDDMSAGSSDQADENASDDAGHETLDRLLALYKLADFLQMHDLQNALLNEEHRLLVKEGEFYNWKGLKVFFKHDLTHTPLYRLAKDSFSEAALDKESFTFFNGDQEDVKENAELASDLLVHIHKYHHKPANQMEKVNTCDYHILPDGKRCG